MEPVRSYYDQRRTAYETMIDKIESEQVHPLYKELSPLRWKLSELQFLAKAGREQDENEKEQAEAYYPSKWRDCAGPGILLLGMVFFAIGVPSIVMLSMVVTEPLRWKKNELGEAYTTVVLCSITVVAGTLFGLSLLIYCRKKKKTEDDDTKKTEGFNVLVSQG